MAVKEANSNYKSFTFNGVSAADYGVYVTDVNVFNSAERAVEYITIPGRNGSFALDHGRFENITVEYECALGQDTDVDFATAISDFRNALAAAKGYQRLEDDMNPDEYRMAVFSKGLEAPTLNQQTATFKVEFNCKPQRYLKSGETAISVTSGQTVTNPTPFTSNPLLQIWGYGAVNIGAESVEVMHVPIGEITLARAERKTGNRISCSISTTFDAGALEDTDEITVGYVRTILAIKKLPYPTRQSVITFVSGGNGVIDANKPDDGTVAVRYTPEPFQKNTPRTDTYKWRWSWTSSAQTTATADVTVTVEYRVNGSITVREELTADSMLAVTGTEIERGLIRGYSTRSALGEPLYFDLDLGEAYKEENGEIVSVNNAAIIPAKMPALEPGANTVTFDNTVTQLKLVPRWWKV